MKSKNKKQSNVMDNDTKTSIIVVSIIFIFAISMCWTLMVNGEVKLRNEYNSLSIKANIVMDSMQRTLINEYEVNKDFAKKFVEVANVQALGRSEKGSGASIKAFQESSALGISSEVHMKMMNSVSTNMIAYANIQAKLSDAYYKHQTYCMSFPASLFIGNKATLIEKPDIILSKESRNAIASKDLPLNIIN